MKGNNLINRSKAPIFYLIFETLIFVAFFFYVPQVQQISLIETEAFFAITLITTILYIYASCKDPGYVSPIPLTIEQNLEKAQGQEHRTKESGGKNEIASRQTTNLFIEETNDKRQSVIEALNQRLGIKINEQKEKENEQILNSSDLKSQSTNNQTSIIVENKISEQQQEKQKTKIVICKSEADQVNFTLQYREKFKLYQTDHYDNNQQIYDFYDDMDPNCQVILESQYNINELESLESLDDSNSNQHALDNGVSISTRQDSPNIIRDFKFHNQSSKKGDKKSKSQRKNNESIDDTQIVSERTIMSQESGGKQSFVSFTKGTENEQKQTQCIQKNTTALNTDFSCVQEGKKESLIKEINKNKSPISFNQNGTTKSEFSEQQQKIKKEKPQQIQQNLTIQVQSQMGETTNNNILNQRYNQVQISQNAQDLIDDPFIKQQVQKQNKFYIMNEEERKSTQVFNVEHEDNNIEEEKQEKYNDSMETNEQNLDSHAQQEVSDEEYQDYDNQQNVIYVSSQINDNHIEPQDRDVNNKMPIDFNLKQDIEEFNEEAESQIQNSDQNIQSSKKENLGIKRNPQANTIVVENRYCTICNLEQPIRAKHCRDCGRCVATHDHHCPWLGTCIGEKNRCQFW